jgi:hypothetical protein
LRFCAFIFAAVFLALGITGFAAQDSYLLGRLHVNSSLNAIYILTGAAAGSVGFMSRDTLRLYFQIVGFCYGMLALLGFVYGEQNLLGVVAGSPTNTWLHVIAATNALILGYN